MTLPTLSRAPYAALAFAAVAFAALPARAQGSEEQQEACTPDAVRLCQATIPDIPKTTACMKEHFSQLSKRCKLVFNDATGGGKADAPPPAEGQAVAPPPPDADPAPNEAAADPGVTIYEAQIRSYCRQGLIDPYTCRSTLSALHAAQ